VTANTESHLPDGTGPETAPLEPETAPLAAGTAAPAPPGVGSGYRRHRLLVAVMLALATIVSLAAILAVWTKRQVLEEASWERTSTALLADPVIRDRLAGYLVDQLYANVDVGSTLEPLLPEEVQPLAGPLSSGLKSLTDQAVEEALSRPAIQDAWQFASVQAHRALIAVLEDRADSVQIEDGFVVLDLGTMLKKLATSVGLGEEVADRIPEGAAKLPIAKAEQVEKLRAAANALQVAANVLVVLAILLFAAAIWLARGYRARAVAGVGAGLVIAGAMALLLRDWLGQVVVDSVVDSQSTSTAAFASWDILTGLLHETSDGVIIVGAGFAIAGFLGSNSRFATGLRRALIPVARDPLVYTAVTTGAVILLLMWRPFEGMARPQVALIIVLLLALGAYAWRRQILAGEPPGSDET